MEIRIQRNRHPCFLLRIAENFNIRRRRHPDIPDMNGVPTSLTQNHASGTRQALVEQ